MKTLANVNRMKSVQMSSVLPRSLRIGALFPVFILGFTVVSTGCACPPAVKTPGAAIQDNAQHREGADTLLRTASARQTWTDEDERAFHRHLSQLSPETRLALAKQLSSLITSSKLVIHHNPPADQPPPVCQCLPAQCTPGGTGGVAGTASVELPPAATDTAMPKNEMPAQKSEPAAVKRKKN
jgi:hypothetical protein